MLFVFLLLHYQQSCWHVQGNHRIPTNNCIPRRPTTDKSRIMYSRLLQDLRRDLMLISKKPESCWLVMSAPSL
ncbi:hypothetical protein MHYP_G00193640 [Metynnis hypsauchen]